MVSMSDLFHHPKRVCLSYYQHLRFSLNISKKLFIGSIQAFIHALYPDAFVTSTTDLLTECSREMEKIGCRNSNT